MSASSIVGGGVQGALAGAKFGPWGAAIGGGLGLLGGALGGGKTPAEKASDAMFKAVPGWIDQDKAATGSALANLNTSGNFYNTVLNGNREQINNILSPQTSTILSQYDNAANTIRQFSPRGGGSTASLAQLPFAKGAAYGQAFQGVLPGAAQGLAGVAGQQGQIGAGLRSSATGAGGEAFNYVNLQAQQQAALGKGIGQQSATGGGLGDIVNMGKGLGGWLAKILTKGGGGGGSSFDSASFGDPEA